MRTLIKAGDRVSAGDPVALIESMKLEYPVVIDLPVTIDEWIVSENDPVKAGQEIARFTSEDEE